MTKNLRVEKVKKYSNFQQLHKKNIAFKNELVFVNTAGGGGGGGGNDKN